MAGWVGRCPARPQRGLGGSVGFLGKIPSGFPICLLNGWLKVKDVIPTNGRDGCVSNKKGIWPTNNWRIHQQKRCVGISGQRHISMTKNHPVFFFDSPEIPGVQSQMPVWCCKNLEVSKAQWLPNIYPTTPVLSQWIFLEDIPHNWLHDYNTISLVSTVE